MRQNPIRRALAEGRPVVGTMLAELNSPALPMVLARCGMDFVFLDMEHGPFDMSSVAYLCKVARLAGIAPLVRVPDALYHLIARVLDAGAMGVMVPRVETRETVERMLRALRYPPQGERGCSIGRGNSEYVQEPLWEYTRQANQEILAVVQVEKREAVENIDQLLSVPGVDVALIGPMDLTLSLGAATPKDPQVQDAILRVLEAGRRHGVATGIHLRDKEHLRHWRDKGMSMLMYSTELGFIAEQASQAVNFLKG